MSSIDTEANEKAVAEFLERFGILLSERHNIPLEDVKRTVEGIGQKYDFIDIAKAPEEEVLEEFSDLWSEEKV